MSNDSMTTQDKIEKAEDRIKELKVLIFHWKNSIEKANYRELCLVEQNKTVKDKLQAA